MLKNGLKPVVIVLNNKGYTIERLLSDDFNAQYNDISQMNYSKFARVFEGDIWSTRVETEDDFDKALKVSQIMNKLCYIEVVMDSNDFPELAGKVLSDMKNVTKNENSENISASESTKAFSKIHKGIMNFATKVHESLR